MGLGCPRNAHGAIGFFCGFSQDRRFIRALGNYSLPMDTFGIQVHEPSFGNLQIGPQSGGRVPIAWLGRLGVQLQTTTNLASPVTWENWPATDGLSFTNPVTAALVEA